MTETLGRIVDSTRFQLFILGLIERCLARIEQQLSAPRAPGENGT